MGVESESMMDACPDITRDLVRLGKLGDGRKA